MSKIDRSESVGDSLCPVCHEQAEIFAIGECDHPICYRCSTRMRVLCSQTDCPICRGVLPQVVFITTKQKYEAVDRRNCIPNRKHKILLEDESVEDAYEALLEHRCRVCDTGPLFDSFSALQTHMRRTHTLFACDLCVSHLKIFPFERKFYNRKDLATHRRTGDPDNRSYRGHPLCRFCDERHMDNDELFRHLRKTHYYCHFCDTNTSNNEYYNDYPDLKEHFRTRHFLCEEGECGSANARFTHAFASEIDLKAHVATEHVGNKSKAQVREMRTLDVNFQMAPRRRGRGGGVTSSEDYEELRGSGRGQRDRHQRSRNDTRFESYTRSDNQTPPPEASAAPSPRPPALEDDFPTLGNCPPPFVPAVQKKVQDVEDFPSLSSQTQPHSSAITSPSLTSSSGKPSKAKANSSMKSGNQTPLNNFSTIASLVTNSGSSHITTAPSRPAEVSQTTSAPVVTKNTWAAPRLASGEDFPSLGSDKKSKQIKDGPNLVSLGVWTKKQKADARSRPSSGHKQQLPVSELAPSLASLGQTLHDDEFPTLGGNAAVSKQATWVQKNTAPTKKKKAESATPLGNTRNMVSLNKNSKQKHLVNGVPEMKTDEKKANKKKKKEKDKEEEPKSASEDSGISLSSIASGIDAMVVTPKTSSEIERENVQEPSGCLLQETKTEQLENAELEMMNSKRSDSFRKNDPTSLKDLPKEVSGYVGEGSKADDKENKNVLSTVKDKTFHVDDFPALSNVAKTKSASADWEKGGGKKKKGSSGVKNSKQFQEDDFPVLGRGAEKTKPPPGFKKPVEIAAPPPGLSTCVNTLGSMPPGLNSSSAASPLSLGSSGNSIPLSVKLNMHTYLLPVDATARNSALVTRVRQLLILKDGGFDKFRALSGEFRSGLVNAQMYYKKCQDLFGQEKFLEVLPELIALLPDILKQHELAEAHKQDIFGICAPLNLPSCPTCYQLLKLEDSPAHLTAHASLAPDIAATGFSASLPIKT